MSSPLPFLKQHDRVAVTKIDDLNAIDKQQKIDRTMCLVVLNDDDIPSGDGTFVRLRPIQPTLTIAEKIANEMADFLTPPAAPLPGEMSTDYEEFDRQVFRIQPAGTSQGDGPLLSSLRETVRQHIISTWAAMD